MQELPPFFADRLAMVNGRVSPAPLDCLVARFQTGFTRSLPASWQALQFALSMADEWSYPIALRPPDAVTWQAAHA